MGKREKANDKIDITSVARAAGVSAATVSRAFNHPEIVRAPTRKRIEAAVEQLGYIRNRAARTMHGRRSGTVGLVLPTVTSPIFSEMMQAFSDTVDAEGFTILIATHGYDLRREVSVLRKLLEHRVDGIALIGLDHQEAAYTMIERQGVPAIAIWNHDPASRLPCVGVDNLEAGYRAMRHLLDLGHRRVALALPPLTENERARGRMAGAERALTEAGIPTQAVRRVDTVYNVSRAKAAVLSLLAEPDPPTALLCGNDVIAQGAVYAAQQAGLAVPEALSIMGIGDFPGSADIEPGLSTVRLPAERIGRLAGCHLTEAIAGQGPAIQVRECCDVMVVQRATTGPPRAA
ncbi:MAG: LacI family DNA-binding transcriptional regulator [Pseudomonadota bacterium]